MANNPNQNYPTLMLCVASVISWLITGMGLYLILLSYWSDSLFDVLMGAGVLLVGAVASTLVTLWAVNEIGLMRAHARRQHPSYPYKLN